MKKKTHEEYVNELHKINPNIKVLGTYNGNKFKILHKCLIDGYEWFASPSNILGGTGCPVCKGKTVLTGFNDLATTNSILSNQWNYNKNKKLHPTQVTSGSRKKVWWICDKGHEWEAMICSRSNGCGCPECGKESSNEKRTKSHEQYVEEANKINPNIIVSGEYINSHTPILHKCKIDNYEWYASPSNILSGKGCPQCMIELSKNNLKKSHEQYVQEVGKINPDIIVLGTYVNAQTKILHQCKIDGFKWEAKPTHVLAYHGCPICKASIGEKKIREYLDSNKITFTHQYTFDDCKNILCLPFDFYLPDYNTCIEYDGIQHFQPNDYFGGEKSFRQQQHNDMIKTQYCKNNNITLLRINYKQDVVKELNNFLL